MPEIFCVRRNVDERHWIVRLLKLEENVCVKLADFVITSEHTKRDRLLENGLKLEKSDVILNLANPSVFPEVKIGEPDNTGGRPFRIVYHGTLTRRLGVDIVLRAIAIARRDVPNIRFEVTGDGDQRAELTALTQELGIESNVRFSDGFVPVEELHSMLIGADLGVMASRDNAATALMLPVKLLEYIRLGIPCVAVPTKTIAYYFSEPAVRFIPPENPEALAATVVELYRDPKARADMARKARAFYEKYTFEAQGRRYLEIVHGLSEHRAPLLEVG
jgi:glycosyltransferase involved in cell wall biosynthesis